jgi:hypothetical protein
MDKCLFSEGKETSKLFSFWNVFTFLLQDLSDAFIDPSVLSQDVLSLFYVCLKLRFINPIHDNGFYVRLVTLITEAVSTSETYIKVCQITRRNNQEESDTQSGFNQQLEFLRAYDFNVF